MAASGHREIKVNTQMAYFWGWPLVANANRAVAFSKVPEPGLVGGVVPIAFGGIALLTDYVTPDQRVIACANQDVRVWHGISAAGQRALRHPGPGLRRALLGFRARSEERRVGKECRSRWSPYH